MPLYFFDRTENGEFFRGEDSMEFSSIRVARHDALRALTETIRDELDDDTGEREFTIHIRDRHRQPILSVSLIIRVKSDIEQSAARVH